jgi:hypothetical protein
MKPWEKYAQSAQPASEGPWAKYAQQSQDKPPAQQIEPQQPPQQDPLAGMYEQPQTQSDRPQITGGRGIAGQRTQQAQYDEQQALDQYKQIEAGQLSASDLPAEQVEAIRKARINAIPELSGLGANVDFGSALAGLTAFNPEEMGAIISKSDPNIGIVTTHDGETLAVNNKTGAAVNLNKAGPSITDALQMGAAAAAFTPAGRAASIPGMMAAGMGTQALIETGQEVAGGEFNVGDVALAGAAPVVASKAIQGVKSGIRSFKNRSPAAAQYLDDQLQGATQQADDMALTPIERQPRNDQFLQRVNQPVKESVKKAEIRQAMRDGTKEAAGYTLDRRGRVVSDPIANQAIKQGFDERTVATIKFGTSEDKQAMSKMLDMAEETLKSGTARVRNRPQKIIGDTVMKRYKTILGENKKASKEIGEAASNQLKGKQIDISQSIDSFSDDLYNLGVKEGHDGLSFTGSQIEGNKATTAIRRVYDRLKTEDDGLSLHKLKQYIDNQISWDKSPDKPLDKQAVNALKKLRENINEKLRAESSDYLAANDRYRETIGALNDFAEAMGKRKFDPNSARVDDFVGQELRKVLSNYGVRNDMIIAIDKLDEVARKYGASFNDDPLHQVVFYSDLEKMLGSFADNSLQGVSEKAGMVVSAARGDIVGVGQEVLRSGVKKALGRNEEKAIQSVRRLLKESK